MKKLLAISLSLLVPVLAVAQLLHVIVGRSSSVTSPPSFSKAATCTAFAATCTATFTGGVTTGDVIVCAVGWNQAAPTMSTMTICGTSVVGSPLDGPTLFTSRWLATYTHTAASTGACAAVPTLSAGGSRVAAICHAYSGSSGVDTHSAFNFQAAPNNNPDNVTANEVTPSVNNTVVMGVTYNSAGAAGQTISAGTGYTGRSTVNTGTSDIMAGEDKTVVTAAPTTLKFTLGMTSGTTISGAITIKP